MNKYILKLYNISQKNTRRILGLMSGTSMDGLDVAVCDFKGSGNRVKADLLKFETLIYDDAVKNKIREVFAKQTVDFAYLTLLHAWLGRQHGLMVLDFLKKWNIPADTVDCIASHGQTVMHVPFHQHHFSDFSNGTFQIGDGDHLACATGIITISDFRQKHVAAGGEGAPLSVYGDYGLFSQTGENRIMLNIGGISNFTFLPADGSMDNVFVTDTGPGNTLMDQFMQKYFQKPFDKDAYVAVQGTVNEKWIQSLLNHAFFQKPFPKTTGQEVFHLDWVENTLFKGDISDDKYHVMATLNYLSAVSIAKGIKHIIGDGSCHIFVSGGGAHNPLLMYHLRFLLPGCHFAHNDSLDIPGDAKEALLFAYLANETLAGQPAGGGQQGRIPRVNMGKISFPE